jgi:hypothetical protein
MLRKLLISSALTVSLAGCAWAVGDYDVLTGTSVPAQTVIVAATAFDGVEGGATAYMKGCQASPASTYCAPATVKIVANAIWTGRHARNQLEAFMAANPDTPAPVSLYNVLTTALATLQTISTQYGWQ